ncbi:tetratricopeptide repeat protein [Tautonia plasticadhaerens]|uniref:Tetratricopeptide repeat protein n=1 Tax=Tautonia plasticadhaerens TaxID=2527974 RepID=A0A518H6V0_9BACT|nr:tetratricopeptide repeat protein [Tautonia plasticadhaerens]QDV36600.1 hypothetical protein ElP_45280 [Tautonia plasticadhaerens]
MPRRPPRARPRRRARPAPGHRRGLALPPARARALLAAAGLVGVGMVLALAVWGRASRPSTDRESGRRDLEVAAPPTPADPTDARGWLLRIDRLRVEDRPIEALEVGRRAYAAVPPPDRPGVLAALTLAMLADVPEAQAVESLRARLDADPGDLDARVALIRRSIRAEGDPAADRPRVGRPSSTVPDAVAELESILVEAPGHLGSREALVGLLLDLGRVDRARTALDAWPEDRLDDPRRRRLRARIDLDHGDRPDRAAEEIGGLIASVPHDWRLRARLARALEMAGDERGARREAALVDRLRERLDPDRLGPRLARDLRDPDDPGSMRDLAELCASVGLVDLAAAWRIEANALGPGGRAGGSR